MRGSNVQVEPREGSRTALILRIAALALTATVCMGLAQAPPAGASAFPGGNGEIVFDQTTGQGINAPTTTHIYAVNPGGSNPHALSSGNPDTSPRVSADGKWIVFMRGGFKSSPTPNTATHVMIMRIDGSDVTDLSLQATPNIESTADSDLDPSLSPDGKTVVFERFDKSTTTSLGIYKMSVTLPSSGPATAGPAGQITNGKDRFPTVSADGKLAFTRATADLSTASIYIAPSICAFPCTTATQLTKPDSSASNFDDNPDFSPDGSEVAFDRQFGAQNGIYVVGSGGGSPVLFAANPPGGLYERPSFSPDGTQIVLDENTETVGPGGSPAHALLTMAAAPGATPTQIPGQGGSATVSNQDPDWAVVDATSTSVSCSPASVTVGSQSRCTATVTDNSSSPSPPGGGAVFGVSPPGAGSFSGSNACQLQAVSASASSCFITFTTSQAGTDTFSAVYNGDATHAASSTDNGVLTVTALPSQLTVHIVFSCPSDAPRCGAPYQAVQRGAGRVLGITSNLGVGVNFDCWGPSPPPGFVESSGFAETCSLPVSAGQTLDLSAYANTYGAGACSLLFCPGTGWPPWKVQGFSSSANVSGCSGLGATCAAKMGPGQNDVTVTLVPADQKPQLGGVGWALKGISGYPLADSSCRVVSGKVDESTCKHPWIFADGAADLDHDPHLSYTWSWGDGTADNCPAGTRWAYLCSGGLMAHSYAKPGDYTVTVSVIDQDGQAVTATAKITISPLGAFATETFSSALGSSVVSTSKPGGGVTTALVLPAPATKVTDSSLLAACGQKACTAAVRKLLLGKLVKRHLKQGGLILKLRPTNHKLLEQIKAALHSAHKHTLRATLTILIALKNHKTIRVVQHIKLRF